MSEQARNEGKEYRWLHVYPIPASLGSPLLQQKMMNNVIKTPGCIMSPHNGSHTLDRRNHTLSENTDSHFSMEISSRRGMLFECWGWLHGITHLSNMLQILLIVSKTSHYTDINVIIKQNNLHNFYVFKL